MKYNFNNSELVKKSYSLDMQDIFVMTATNGMKNGTFLEIGCHLPINNNNTYNLESVFNWSGVSIDLFEEYANEWKFHRPNTTFLATDALNTDYEKLLSYYFPTINIIDYLQLDIEPSINTLSALKRIPFDKFKFRTITYETDFYAEGDYARNESRKILSTLGYELVAGDVLTCYIPNQISPYEDWWVHPDLVDRNIINTIKEKSLKNSDPRYFLVYDLFQIS